MVINANTIDSTNEQVSYSQMWTYLLILMYEISNIEHPNFPQFPFPLPCLSLGIHYTAFTLSGRTLISSGCVLPHNYS